MTVATTPVPRVEYVEDGVTTTHDIPFKFIEAGDIDVIRILEDGTEVVLAQPTHYSVTGGDWSTGGIVKVNGGTDGATLRIDRNTDRKQPLDYINNDDFGAENHEHGLDRAIFLIQELKRDMLTESDVIDIILATIVAGDGIELDPDAEGGTLTITNIFDAEYIRDTIGTALVAAAGIQITVDDASNTITITSTALGGDSQNCLLLAGAGVDTSLMTAEFVRDTIAAALQGAAGVTIVVNDAGDTITVTGAGSADAELIRDTIGTALTAGAGITVTPNDGGDIITVAVVDEYIRDLIHGTFVAGAGMTVTVDDAGNTITLVSTRLAADYAGIVPTAHAASFDLADAMNGRGLLLTTGAAVVTIRDEADVPLSGGFTTVLRNNSGASWTIVRDTSVSLKVNGGTASANATLANGGVATITRWAADDFTIVGAGLS